MSVECPYCQKTFKNIKTLCSGHLKRIHNIDSKTYYDTYMKKEDEDKCLVCKKQTDFISLKLGYKKFCCAKCKFRTKQYRENLSKGINNSIKFKQAKETEEYRNKQRQNKIALYKNNPDVKEKISNTLKEKHKNDPKIFEKASTAITKAIIAGKLRTRYFYDNINFDSSWEIIFYIGMKLLNKNIKRNTTSLSYSYSDGIIRKYIPDFIVEGKLYEVKGLHFFENRNPNGKMICPYGRKKRTVEENIVIDGIYEAKHQCMIQNNITIITNVDYFKKLLEKQQIDISTYKIKK